MIEGGVSMVVTTHDSEIHEMHRSAKQDFGSRLQVGGPG